MKLATFLAPGSDSPQAGVVGDDRVAALSDGLCVADVLAGAQARTGDASWPLADVRLLAPVPEPGTVYAIGLNYAEHVAETGGQRPRGADRVRQGWRLDRPARRPDHLP